MGDHTGSSYGVFGVSDMVYEINKENISSKQLERTDSVRSSKSVKSVASPPPKKHDKDQKSKMGPIWPKKQETPVRKWEMTPMSKENEMDTEQAHEKGMEIAEDLRLANMLVVTLKRENDQLRHINKTQIENNSQTIKHLQSEHLRAIKVFDGEHNKALQEISRLTKETQLMKAREQVLTATLEDSAENQEEECIMDVKCKGKCRHIVEEDLRNKRLHQCPQCDNTFQNISSMDQHVKEFHTKYPNCPFCRMSFTNLKTLRKHIEEHHPDTTLQSAPTTEGLTAGPSTTPTELTEEEVSNSTPQDTRERGVAEGQRQEDEDDGGEVLQEETGVSQVEEEWHQEERHGNRFRCQTCGYTRNTRSQLNKHIRECHEENNDNSAAPQNGLTCQDCSYQTISRDQLIEHIERTHTQNISTFKCDICKLNFRSQKEINIHNRIIHKKSLKPCRNFPSGNCEYDDDCNFNHVILNQGDQICYKCGDVFGNTTLLIRHITNEHGEEPCKKFAANKCNFGDRCHFKHIISPAQYVHNNVQEPQAHEAPQVFYNPPTTGQHPMVGQQERMMHQMMTQLLTQMMTNINLK